MRVGTQTGVRAQYFLGHAWNEDTFFLKSGLFYNNYKQYSPCGKGGCFSASPSHNSNGLAFELLIAHQTMYLNSRMSLDLAGGLKFLKIERNGYLEETIFGGSVLVLKTIEIGVSVYF
jgi:hypothetical protein